MIHAKILLVDNLWGIVGSTNCDYRSFGLNDEVNLAVRDPNFVQGLEKDFVSDTVHSHQVTYEQWRRRNIFERAPNCSDGFCNDNSNDRHQPLLAHRHLQHS